MDVIENVKGDATLRQISEAVRIEGINKRADQQEKMSIDWHRPTVSSCRQINKEETSGVK